MKYRITKVYTKQGDKGTTRLGGGQLVSKDSIRVKAYGEVDELNSAIGIVLAFEPIPEIKDDLVKIQHELFVLGSDLCVLEEDKTNFKMEVISEKHVTYLENLMDKMNEELKPLEDFILPGGCKTSAFLHQARTICRRAETTVTSLTKQENINATVIKYLNRLSDALFVLARYQNFKTGFEDIYWTKGA